ncbi:MAG TPA: family 43 glycosylhydrolase [Acidobacteriota bacterium]|nr:family 43 glycosylhydrolase [Acidobacteriota bacterium]
MVNQRLHLIAPVAKNLSALLALAGVSVALHAANPFLPGYEHIPDGEPRVYGDRVYLYGSHDKAGSERFCDYILKAWSAPLNNLNEWTDHGILLSTRDVPGRKDDVPFSDYEFYAPEMVALNGKYYLYAQVVGAPCSVAVSDTPVGPFKVISTIKAPAGSSPEFGGWGQYFDPGVLVDDDGKVYLYWGGGRSYMAQLDPKTMTDVLPDTLQVDVIPREAPFEYQEGPSPRKINGLYYLVYARGLDLAYATSDKPTGPFAYRGAIVSQRNGAHGGNIHGGLAQINGQWHIFYHRMTNNSVFSRRACVERVTIEADGTIKTVEQTSLGFEEILNPYKVTAADIACVFHGGSFVTEFDKRTQAVVGNKHDSVVGYKYFDFGQPFPGQQTIFTVQLRDGAAAGNIEVWLGDPQNKGERIGVVTVEKKPEAAGWWREITIPVRNVSGRHALYLRFTSETANAPVADLRSFVFTRDTL